MQCEIAGVLFMSGTPIEKNLNEIINEKTIHLNIRERIYLSISIQKTTFTSPY